VGPFNTTLHAKNQTSRFLLRCAMQIRARSLSVLKLLLTSHFSFFYNSSKLTPIDWVWGGFASISTAVPAKNIKCKNIAYKTLRLSNISENDIFDPTSFKTALCEIGSSYVVQLGLKMFLRISRRWCLNWKLTILCLVLEKK